MTKQQKLERQYWEMIDEAKEAGTAAVEKLAIKPMVVVSWGGERHIVEDGPCGFAWVMFPGNDKFGRWAKRVGISRKGYPTGQTIWISEFNQSYEKKRAYASAFAEVLRKYGIKAWPGYRLD